MTTKTIFDFHAAASQVSEYMTAIEGLHAQADNSAPREAARLQRQATKAIDELHNLLDEVHSHVVDKATRGQFKEAFGYSLPRG